MRSEDIFPDDLVRLLRRPQVIYILSCAGLVLAVIVCFFGVRAIADGRMEAVGPRLSNIEQASIERALLKNGLSKYEFRSGQLCVPAGQRDEYVAAITTVDFGPRDPGSIRRAATDNRSIWMSNMERQRRYGVGEQEAIAELLKANASIDDAYVNIDEARLGGLRPTAEIKAFVSIQLSAGSKVDTKLLSSIRRIVAAHKAGLLESNVTVANRESGDSWDGSVGGSDSVAQAREMRQVTLQNEWDQKVSHVLKFIPGAKVETHVELVDGPESSENQTRLHPLRVAISVAVPAGYYQECWRQQSTENEEKGYSTAQIAKLEAKTRDKIESLVRGLISGESGVDSPSVHVAMFQQVHPTTAMPTTEAPTTAWLRRNANRIMQGGIILLAVGLVFVAFRDLFYEDVPEEDEHALPEKLRVYTDTTAAVNGHRQSTSPVPPDVKPIAAAESRDSFVHADLTDLVREHPQAATAILKSWVEKAS